MITFLFTIALIYKKKVLSNHFSSSSSSLIIVFYQFEDFTPLSCKVALIVVQYRWKS